jgi:hypothetical protein
MFVSSYSTYIHTNRPQSTEKQAQEREKQNDSFSTRLLHHKASPTLQSSASAVDYIAKNNAFWQKLELQKQQEGSFNKDFLEKTKLFEGQKTLSSAKQAYTEGAKFFSISPKHTGSLDLTPKIDKKLPNEIKEIKEKIMRNLMVTTYIANDNYYKITA